MDTLLFPHLTLTSFCLPLEGELRRCCTVAAGFSLLEQGPGNLLPADEAWQAAAAALEEGALLDMGLPKMQAEWLLAGAAWPTKPDQMRCVCHMRVGSLKRCFLVHGDRLADGLGRVETAPLASLPPLPLSWSNTFGGSHTRENPLGKGDAPDARGLRSLPNIEDRERPGSACPGPLMPQFRECPKGTYDATWLQTRWPGVPEDFDWSWYNLAQPCQRQNAAFTGTEKVHVANMHPAHKLLQSSLAAVRLRFFVDYVKREAGAASGWHEVAARCDTVWLFPNAACGLLLWHAVCPTRDEKSSDIARLAVCYEPCAGPRRTLDELWAEREQLVQAATAKTRPTEAGALAPEPQEEAAAAAPVPSAVAVGQPEMPGRPDIPEAPAAAPAPAPPQDPVLPEDPGQALNQLVAATRDNLDAVLAEVNPRLEAQGFAPLSKDMVDEQLSRQHAAMASLLQEQAPDTAQILARAGLTQDDLDKLVEAATLTPPARAEFATEEAYDLAMEQFGDRFAALAHAPAGIRDNLVRQMKLLDSVYSAPHNVLAAEEAQPPVDPLLAQALQQQGLAADAEHLERALASLEHLPDSSDAALQDALHSLGLAMGLDPGLMTDQLQHLLGSLRVLSYQDASLQQELLALAGHFPEDAGALASLQTRLAALDQRLPALPFDLRSLGGEAGIQTNSLLDALEALDPLPVAGHPMPDPEAEAAAGPGDGQSLAQGMQEEPRGAGDAARETSRQAGDTLPPEQARMADFSDQDLTAANFAGLDLTGARFDRARLADANFQGANLTGASFAGAVLTRAHLDAAQLDRADCTGADLTGASLIACTAQDTTFDKALLQECDLQGLQAPGASFAATQGKGIRFAGCHLERASFVEADLSEAHFVGAKLTGTTFESCQLARAVFEQTQLLESRFYFCQLEAARFGKAQMAGTNWLRCQGSRVDLRETELAGAVFEDCALPACQLCAASARRCRFLSCDLHGADLRLADFLDGALRDCKLGSADVRGASLFAADLLHAAVNGETSFAGALTERTCLHVP